MSHARRQPPYCTTIRVLGALRTPSGICVTSFKAGYLRCTELEPGASVQHNNNSLLTSLAMFVLSFKKKHPKGLLQKLDYYLSHFFWQCDKHKKIISQEGVFSIGRKILVDWAYKT